MQELRVRSVWRLQDARSPLGGPQGRGHGGRGEAGEDLERTAGGEQTTEGLLGCVLGRSLWVQEENGRCVAEDRETAWRLPERCLGLT